MNKYGVQLLSAFITYLHTLQHPLFKNQLKCIGNTIITLYISFNSVKILTMQYIENFKSTSILSHCLPAVGLTSTRSMALELLHNKGNHVRVAKLFVPINIHLLHHGLSFHPSLPSFSFCIPLRKVRK